MLVASHVTVVTSDTLPTSIQQNKLVNKSSGSDTSMLPSVNVKTSLSAGGCTSVWSSIDEDFDYNKIRSTLPGNCLLLTAHAYLELCIDVSLAQTMIILLFENQQSNS